MNILMVTESADACADGVARSVASLVAYYRAHGHRVLQMCPGSAGPEDLRDDPDRILLATIQAFTDSDFAVSFPSGSVYEQRLQEFRPNIVHVHHPLVVGSAGFRIASKYSIPLVFSHHARYDLDPRYVPVNSSYLRHLAGELAIEYCRLSDSVLAPNHSMAVYLTDRGVATPIEIAPTGVALHGPAERDRTAIRHKLGIPDAAFVVGHLSRLTLENNGPFLARCIAHFLQQHPHTHFLAIDHGSLRELLQNRLSNEFLRTRCHFIPTSERFDIADVCRVLDVLAFVSRTDFQAVEILEAQAAGVPVVALDAPAVRELVHDGENGRLVRSASRRAYVDALGETLLSQDARAEWRRAAFIQAEKFSTSICGDRILGIYANLIRAHPERITRATTEWETIRRRVESEWRLWNRRAHAAAAALRRGRHPSRVPVLRHIFRLWRNFRYWFSRREWSVRLLDLPTSQGTSDEPGLVLLQIDGLARYQLETALKHRRMPFLRRLLNREGYCIHTMYSGQPATTPAVLGELFYGVEQAVPAFGFRDHRTRSEVQMFQPGIASRIQAELAQQGEGLLSGGSAYCGIYSGEAHDSSFCPATTGWRNIEDANMWRRIALFLLNVMSLVRILGLVVIEIVVAVCDCIRGIINGRDLLRELLFVPRRVMVNVLLRELIAISVETDVTRGVPVVHANFLGYDENAHRRGPSALFAHYALRGIDHAIGRIWNAAHASCRRNYHVWIMSDHGQERTMAYDVAEGEWIGTAIARLYQGLPRNAAQERPADQPTFYRSQAHRANWIHGKPSSTVPADSPDNSSPPDGTPATIAIGPLGYVYWPTALTDVEVAHVARRMVDEAHVPLVMAVVGGKVRAWNARGEFVMPEDAAKVLPANHPHLADVARDFTRLCFHPNAGQFLISGWQEGKLPLSFVRENGAHGGPGPNETSGFVIIPADAPFPHATAGTFRPGSLRSMAQQVLRRRPIRRFGPTSQEAARAVRIATYNIHGCIGLDGRLSPARIARVLAATDPDIVALQEVDVRRARSGLTHQVEQIAHALEMRMHFHPSFRIEEEQYGNAILSRFPIKLKRAGPLPQLNSRQEPRGALWVEIQVPGGPLQIITTHLGTTPAERSLQIDELLGPNWLGHPECGDPLILCGDLNLMPGSKGYRRIAARLRDVQLAADRHQPRRTWFGPFPLTRIDHVFISQSLRVKQVNIPMTRLARVASDHLPLLVDLEMTELPQEESSPSELVPVRNWKSPEFCSGK